MYFVLSISPGQRLSWRKLFARVHRDAQVALHIAKLCPCFISSSLQPQWYRIIRMLAANFEEHCFGSPFLGFDLAKGSLLAVQMHFAYLMPESRVILCIEDTPDNLDEILNWESDQRLSFIFDVCIQHSNLERWYQELEQYVRNTTHTSNDALTASAVYPPYLSLHEIFVSGHFVWRSL